MSKAKKVAASEDQPLQLIQGHVRVTLECEDFEISPALATNYRVGQSVMAEGQSLDTLFVGGHPIKGRNG